MNELISKANDKGSTLIRFGPAIQGRFLQQMQDEIKPRHRILIVDNISDGRQKSLGFMVGIVRAEVSAWPISTDFVGFSLESGSALHDDCTYEAPVLAWVESSVCDEAPTSMLRARRTKIADDSRYWPVNV